MKIVSYNINGIRASARLGILDWLEECDADVICIQEVRSSEEIARQVISGQNPQVSLFDANESILDKYVKIYNCGEIPGYAGTMVLCKKNPDKITRDMGEFWTDKEGRTTTVFWGDLAVVNSYIPNGGSRLEFKMQYIDALTKYILKLREKYKVICVGDFNIAHNEIDLTNPKECKNKSVFLPIERKAFDNFISNGFIDSFRYLRPDDVKYSWRSYRSLYDKSYNSWKYRIDYILVSENLKDYIENADILELPYSDHLPAVLEVKYDPNKK